MLRPSEPNQAHSDVFAATTITVVIPCFNEEEAVEQLVERLDKLSQQLTQHELRFIIVDDGSRDLSVPVIHRLIAGLPNFSLVRHEENRGVAAAIMTGLQAADTEICGSMDFDCTYDPIQFVPMIPLIRDADVVTASPYHPEGRVLNVAKWRLAISRCASFAYRLVMRQKLYTYTSCFRVYRRDAIIGLPLQHEGFVGVAELLWRIDQQGGTISECPATLNIRKFGQSKMRVAQVTLEHSRFLTGAMFSRLFGRSTPAITDSQTGSPSSTCLSPESNVSPGHTRKVETS